MAKRKTEGTSSKLSRETVKNLATRRAPKVTFSGFRPDHAWMAENLIQRMTAAGEGKGDQEAVQLGLEAAQTFRGTVADDLLLFAVRAFLSEKRSRDLRGLFDKKRPPVIPMEFVRETPEDDLAQWRERLNNHHGDWHTIYRFAVRWTSDRSQGEHFLHMHQQMLAHYDAECIALGFPRIVPWKITEVIPFGHSSLQQNGNGTRAAGKLVSQEVPASRIQFWKNQFQLADIDVPPWFTEMGSGQTDSNLENRTNNGDATKLSEFRSAHELGASLEQPYHNFGHVLVSEIAGSGDMGDTFASHRDPIFWAWHKHIDDIAARWQELQGTRTLEGPQVRIRKNLGSNSIPDGSPDMVFRAGSGGLGPLPNPDLDLGGNNWDQPVPSESSLIQGAPFHFYCRLKNESNAQQQIEGRLFVVPEAHRGDRRAWIQLDQFDADLQANERKVVSRSSADFWLVNHGVDDGLQSPWPAEILLPAAGTYIALLILNESSGGHHHGHHGSVSMGYPFDRTWPEPIDVALSNALFAGTVRLKIDPMQP